MRTRLPLAAILAANVKAIREAKDRMSQADIKEESGRKVDPKTISNIENRKHKPQLDSIEAIAEAFEIEPYLLLIENLPSYLPSAPQLPSLIAAFVRADEKGRDAILKVAEMASRAASEVAAPSKSPNASNG